ncbi:hypothetical protein ACERII_15205 [Evansella sp. AB-rgal1]|uniref:hypothetical protein n=1 Tax=Evansella sp. AB-rgal1 TaxID=3242696 RepID=UPI00359D5743
MIDNKQQKELKRQLDSELSHFSFTKQGGVLSKTHPKTWSEKVNNWWNKEITIPLLPVGAITVLLLLTAGMILFSNDGGQQVELIERGGNIYWSDMYERKVGANES